MINPAACTTGCTVCNAAVDDYLANAQHQYFDALDHELPVCADCLTVFDGSPIVQSLFDRIVETLGWADQWKWETASFEDKFRYAIRVKRLVESGGWANVVADPIRPRLPDTGPPQNAAFQTALELVLATDGDAVKERHERPVAVDLFSGAGGAALGMLDSGFDVTGVERDADARLTHVVNLEHALNEDLSSVDTSIPLPSPEWLHASPPCKGFSRAGLQDPDDDRNELVWTTIEWVNELEPTVVTIEQVPGFQDGDHDKRLRRELEAAGYTVTMEILNAADYGVPQSRRRLIVLAVQTDKGISPSLPSPSHAPTKQQTLTGKTLAAHRTVGDVLPVEREKALARNHSPTEHTDRVAERFDRLEQGQNVTDLENPGTKKASQRRLAADAPAPTITGVPSDYIHPTKNRCLTNRELARLQSFPDWFRFTGPEKGGGGTRGEMATQAEQIGNAVPPRLMKQIGEHVRSLLNSDE